MTTEIPEHIREKADGDVELADRQDALVDTSSTRREWITTENEDGETEVYWFDIKQVSWEEKTDVLDDHIDADDGGDVELNMKGYYRTMMERTIADKSVDGGLATFLKGMKPELGDKLQQLMPDPGTVMDDVDEGNSDE